MVQHMKKESKTCDLPFEKTDYSVTDIDPQGENDAGRTFSAVPKNG